MKQYLHTGSMIVMALAVVALGVMSYSAMRTGQQGVADAFEKGNETMLAAIEAMKGDRAAVASPAVPQYSKLSVQLLDENGQHFDTSGYRVHIGGPMFSFSNEESIDFYPDTNGEFTTGLMRTDNYTVVVFSPEDRAARVFELVLWPGEDVHELEVRCITQTQWMDAPDIKINWPEGMDLEGVSALVEILTLGDRYAGTDWRERDAYLYTFQVTPGETSRLVQVVPKNNYLQYAVTQVPGQGQVVQDRHAVAFIAIATENSPNLLNSEIFLLDFHGFRGQPSSLLAWGSGTGPFDATMQSVSGEDKEQYFDPDQDERWDIELSQEAWRNIKDAIALSREETLDVP